MLARNFWNQLKEIIELPFELESVTAVSGNCGTVHIDMEDGSTYYIDIQKCESDARE
jgi:hypothetical protein